MALSRRAVRALAMAALVWVCPARGSATVVLPADFDAVVAGSQTIVHGRVVDVQSRTTAGRRAIESLVTVDVLEAVKGDPGRQVVFRVPNGQVGRYRRVTVGAPEFAPGDEVVLFLSGRAPFVPMPFGLSQGVYRVVRQRDGQALVAPLPGGRGMRGDAARRPLSVDMFMGLARAAVERQR